MKLSKLIIPLITFTLLLPVSKLVGQEIDPMDLPAPELDRVKSTSSLPRHSLEFNSDVSRIMNQTNLDSLVKQVRILSGEDSVTIQGTRERIVHRISNSGNDLAADYLKQKLFSYDLEVLDQFFGDQGRNVYGIQVGAWYPHKYYIICAHYDAVANYCADDNASGTAAVLEAARVLSKYPIKYSLIYGFWDEEEKGLIGSTYFAEQAKDDQMDILGVLNLDMIGWDSDGDRHADIHSGTVANSNDLAEDLMAFNSLYEINLSPVIYNPGTSASDHASFWDSGYGAVLLIEGYYADDLNLYYHSVMDRVDKFNLPYFHNMGRLAVGFTTSLVEASIPAGLQNTRDFYNDLLLQPNPVTRNLTLTTDYPGEYSIELFTLNGRSIFKEVVGGYTYSMDVAHLRKGVYLVTICSKDFITTRKFIKL